MQWWPETIDDIEESAALIAALDQVVSVDNTVVHLAGALGKSCFAILSRVPDWRYGLEGEGWAWYPSVRLFRQEQAGDWTGVVERMHLGLRA